jgi:hypothetical protein
MPPPRTVSAEPHRSDSAAQREAERVAVAQLGRDLGVSLDPAELTLAEGIRVHVDGYHAGPPAIVVEVFAHQGPLKGGQRHKVMSDAFKLVAIGRTHPGAQLLFVLTDPVAAASAQGGWRGAALKAAGVEVRTVALPAELMANVLAAQARQRMVNETGGDP